MSHETLVERDFFARDSRARMRARAFRAVSQGCVVCVRIGAGTRKYAWPDALNDSPHQVLPLARCASRS